jgi:ubiquinone/menaquinone biosynthesis C-methylase UbiE
VVAFPQREHFLEKMAAAGFTDLSYDDLSLGAVCLYRGTKTP